MVPSSCRATTARHPHIDRATRPSRPADLIRHRPAGEATRPGSAALVIACVLAAGLIAGSPHAGATTLDQLTTGQGPLADPGTTSSVVSTAGVDIAGIERDIVVSRDAGPGTVSLMVASGSLVFSTGAGTTGEALITWDGSDGNAGTLDPTGLGGIDMTQASAHDALSLVVLSATSGATLELELLESAEQSSLFRLVLPAISTPTTFIFPYADMVPGTGTTPASLSSIGAVTLRLAGTDATIELGGPMISTVAAPSIDAELRDTLLDTDADTLGDPGESIRYDLTIRNTGAEATAVQVSDPLVNVTLDGGVAIRTTPIAVRDDVVGVGNVTLAQAAPGVLANDIDVDGDVGLTVDVGASDTISARGGTVSFDVSGNGSFAYTPPPGFRGVDTFAYVLDPVAGDPTPPEPIRGQVVVTVGSMVWFVDDDSTGGTGTQADPFESLAALNGPGGAGDPDEPGDIIYVLDGTYDDDIELESSQQLLGARADLVVGGDIIISASPGAVPMIGNAVAHVVRLADDTTVRGLVLAPANGPAILGSGVSGTVVVDTVELALSGAGSGLDLTGQAGTLTVSGSTIGTVGADTTTGTAVRISGGSASIDLSSGTSISQTGGRLIDIDGTTGATVDLRGTLPTLTSGQGDAIRLTNNSGGQILLGSIGTLDVASGGGLIALDTTSLELAGTGAIAAVGGPALDISSSGVTITGGGPLAITSLSSTGSSSFGVRLDSMAPGVTVSGLTTISSSTGAGIRLVNATGAVTLSSVQVDGTGAEGLYISTGTAPVTLNGGSIGATTPPTGTGVRIEGGSGAVTVRADVHHAGTTTRLVEISGTSGIISFEAGTLIDSNGSGIRVADTLGGSVSFGSGGGSLLLGPAGLEADATPVTLVANAAPVSLAAATIRTDAGITGLDIDGGTGTITVIGSSLTQAAGGTAVDILQGTRDINLAGLTIDNDSSSGAAVVTVQQTTGGAVTFGPIDLAGVSATDAVTLASNAGAVVFAGPLAVSVTSGRALVATGQSGPLSVTGAPATLVASGAAALDLDTVTVASMAFTSISSTGSSAAGIDLERLSGGTLSIAGGTISGAAAAALNVGDGTAGSGGSTSITYSGSIINAAGRAVIVQDRLGGTVSLEGPIIDSGATNSGILIDDNASGSPVIRFTSTIDITGTSGDGVTVSDSPGATISFADLDIDTSSGNQRSLFVTNNPGGRLNIDTGTINAGSGPAVDIDTTMLGNTADTSAGLTLTSVSSVGGTAPGIDLEATTGAFSVIGDGSASSNGSGGTISSKVGPGDGADAVRLVNVTNVQLSHMNLVGNNRNGVWGSGVNGLRIDRSNITANGDQTSPTEGNVRIDELTGTGAGGSNPTSITESLLQNSRNDNALIRNTSGTLTDLLVTNTVFSDSQAAGLGSSGLVIDSRGTAQMKVTVTGSTFDGNKATGLIADTSGTTSIVTAVVSGSTFTGNNVATTVSTANGGSATFEIVNNTAVVGHASHALNTFSNASSTGSIDGTYSGNVIGSSGTTSSGSDLGNGVRVAMEGSGTYTIAIVNNTIQEVANFEGIYISERLNPGSTHVHITGNTIDSIDFDRGVNVESRDTGLICANIQGNTVTNTGSDGIRVRQRDTSTMQVERYTGGAASITDMAAHLAAENPGAASTAASVATTFATPVGDGACRTPAAKRAATITAVGAANQETSAVIDGDNMHRLQVVVRDAEGAPVPYAVVRFVAPDDGPGGRFPRGAIAVTDTAGVASVAFSPNHTAGSFQVTASLEPAVAAPAHLQLVNTQ